MSRSMTPDLRSLCSDDLRRNSETPGLELPSFQFVVGFDRKCLGQNTDFEAGKVAGTLLLPFKSERY
jgi:hypothetical protein